MQVSTLSGIEALVRLLSRYMRLDSEDIAALSALEDLPICEKSRAL
jgi:hypothetical protein